MRQARFEYWEARAGGWWWRLRAANGRIIAAGAEPFSTARAVRRAINLAADTIIAMAVDRGSLRMVHVDG